MEKVEVSVGLDLVGSQLVFKCTDPVGELVSARVVPLSSSTSDKYNAYKLALSHKGKILNSTPDLYEFLELLEELEDDMDNSYWTVSKMIKEWTMNGPFLDRLPQLHQTSD